MNLSAKAGVTTKREKPGPSGASDLRSGHVTQSAGRAAKLASGKPAAAEHAAAGSRLNFRGSVRAISMLSEWDGL